MRKRIQKIDLALILIEQSSAMKELCIRKHGCKTCPFYSDLGCTLVSTDKVMQVAGDAAREYLITSGIYPLDHNEMAQLILHILGKEKPE